MKNNKPKNRSVHDWYGLLCIVFAVALGFSSCQVLPPPGLETPTPQPLPTVTTISPGEVSMPFVIVPPISQDLSGPWHFAPDKQGKGETEGWASSGFQDSAWQMVTVPHTWNTMPDLANFNGLGWYRRSFKLPQNASSANIRLHFEAVFYKAQLWLNGKFVGAHEGGYTPFEFDISSLAVPGENILAVQVDNRRSASRIPADLSNNWSFDWWNYGGIVREVSLEITSRVYIEGMKIIAEPHIIAPDTADSASITATLSLFNTSTEAFDGQVDLRVIDDTTGNLVLFSPQAVAFRLQPGEKITREAVIELSSPKLWHFDHPYLYRLEAELKDQAGQSAHLANSTFGIRQIKFKDGQFLLNGESVRLVGLTRHADSPEYGLAETVQVMAADYQDLKALNEVFSRPAHYPQSKYILDFADHNGILLIPEVPAWQLTSSQMSQPQMRGLEKQQLREMTTSSFNHPSIWAWSIANEIESETGAGQEFVKEMIQYVKALDPTRPVGFASNRLYSNPSTDATRFSDFVMMNQYFGTWGGPKQELSAALDAIHQAWPDKPVIISEFGFEPTWNRLWGPSSSSLDPANFYFLPEATAVDSLAADQIRQRLISEQMQIFREKPFVIGAIFWCYQDYRTPSKFVMGVVDFLRNRRPSWQTLREEFAPAQIESFNLQADSGSSKAARFVLQVRGPVEKDLPAYTLRNYRLNWKVSPAVGGQPIAEGVIDLPVLAPGETWQGEMNWPAGKEDYVIQISVIRPTGYAILENIYDAKGKPVH